MTNPEKNRQNDGHNVIWRIAQEENTGRRTERQTNRLKWAVNTTSGLQSMDGVGRWQSLKSNSQDWCLSNWRRWSSK